tara:strand:+ start:17 stop:1258 length:1242 start_codon:yes stop_codon:yes gene_type:complete
MIRFVYDKLGIYNCGGLFCSAADFVEEAGEKAVCEETTTRSPGVSFYPVTPHELDIWFGFEGTGFAELFSALALSRLQDNKDGLKLLIFFPWEGYDLSYRNHLILNYINLLTTKYSINGSKILFAFGDINLKNTIESYPVKLNIPKENIFGLNIFEWIAYEDSQHSILTSLDVPLKRTRKFLCKNGVARTQRMYLAGALHNKKLLDKFYFSWLNHTKWDYNNQTGDAFSIYNYGETNKEYLSSFIEFIKNEPYILDITSEQARDSRMNQIYINTRLYNSSYASLVTETIVDDYDREILFISEKTYQPIYNLHPFINVGGHGILNFLKSEGYATFPELFDESYDDIKDCSSRLKKIIAEVEKFCNTDSKVLDDIYSSKTFRDKLIHNLTNFRKKKGKQDAIKYVNWLKEYKTFI